MGIIKKTEMYKALCMAGAFAATFAAAADLRNAEENKISVYNKCIKEAKLDEEAKGIKESNFVGMMTAILAYEETGKYEEEKEKKDEKTALRNFGYELDR